MKETKEGLRLQVKEAWDAFRAQEEVYEARAYDIALLVARVVDEKAYLAWGFETSIAWAKTDLGIDGGRLSHFAGVGRGLLALPEEKQQEWREKVPLARAEEVVQLAKKNPQRALELAASDRTRSQLRQAVRAEQPELHHDTSGFVSLTFRVTRATAEHFQRALNLARFVLNKAQPEDDEIINGIAAEYCQTPVEDLDDDQRHLVLAGKAQCVDCKSWERSELVKDGTVLRCGDCKQSRKENGR